MPIPAEEAVAIALSDACEDYTGLYELVWEFNGRFPEASAGERLAAAQTALTHLVEQGLATVWKTHWLSDKYAAIDSPAAGALLKDPRSWESPAENSEAAYYCFASTPKGEARYFARAAIVPPAG